MLMPPHPFIAVYLAKSRISVDPLVIRHNAIRTISFALCKASQYLRRSSETMARSYETLSQDTILYRPSLDLSQRNSQRLVFVPTDIGSLGALELRSTTTMPYYTPLEPYTSLVAVNGHCPRHRSQNGAPKQRFTFLTG